MGRWKVTLCFTVTACINWLLNSLTENNIDDNDDININLYERNTRETLSDVEYLSSKNENECENRFINNNIMASFPEQGLGFENNCIK